LQEDIVSKTSEELKAEVEAKREDIARDLELVGDRVSPGRMVQRRRAAVGQRLRRVQETLTGTPDRLRDQLPDAPAMSDRLSDAPGDVREFTEGNPLAAGIIGFGIGLLAAAVLPDSSKEQRVTQRLQPRLEHAAGELAAAGRDTVDTIKPAAQEAAQAVTESAKESAEAVKQQTATATEQAKTTTKKKASRVRDAVSG
jgi:gas vesicle protein